MAFCTQCGASVDDAARFCPSCGVSMRSTENAENTENTVSSISSNPFFSVPDADELMSSPSPDRTKGTEPVNEIPSIIPPEDNTSSLSGTSWFTQPENDISSVSKVSCHTQPENDISSVSKASCHTQPENDISSVNGASWSAPPENDIPIITPPKRSRAAYSGPVCHHHPGEPATAQCARCGNYVCADCAEAYTVIDGEYANTVLCYDCCEELVSENVEVLKKQKSSIVGTILVTIIGMFIGWGIFFAAEAGAFWMLFGMLWIGSFGTWVKNAISGWWHAAGEPTISGFVGSCLGAALVAPVITAKKIIQGLVYLTKTEKALKNDSEALKQMKDYMEYTQVMSQNAGVSLDSLMGQGSQLYNNSYAQAVRSQGEEAAEAMLRRSATTIAENGETIRNFKA